MTDAVGTLESSSLGEVAWLDATGRPRAAGVLPLVLHGTPVLAMTFDSVALATDLAAAEVVDLVVREDRNTGTGWLPASWRCHSRLVEDVEGHVWLDHLRLQELRRYPPARRYADSLLLSRENWWYLPRLLVELEPVDELPAPPARGGSEDLLLVTARDGRPVAGGCAPADEDLAPTWGPAPGPGDGVVLGQDASFPDLEVWERWTREVAVTSGRVRPAAPLPPPGPPPVPGLRRRWRTERDFSRACRRGLAAWTR